MIVTATRNHTWTTTADRPSITSTRTDIIFIEWRLYQAGTYNVSKDTGGVPVTADIDVQLNDVDGHSNERIYLPVGAGDVRWVRIDKDATTGRAFGTVGGRPEIFSLIGDRTYSSEPESGVEAYWPDRDRFIMGRTAANGFFIRLDNPT